ncbi:MAG: DUF3732 domain-containing protein [Ferrovibrio sp.]|uniref:DUF3732 domain-containing protein n=1 Tax=Ferrovibrio sp. TaxID=1917215 RepID=UPI00391D383E
MSLQILKLVLYSHRGEIRELEFTPGALNILTGASQTGKSAIIDIIDYCTGRTECNVADGVIRKKVSWYAILFQLGEGQIFIARRNPQPGEKTNPDVFMARASIIDIPSIEQLVKNTTLNALEKFLSAIVGISENEHRPEHGTREPLEANFRHALLLSIQDQNDIDSRTRLFHRQGEDFISQAIKDTLPYFIGAIDEDRLLKQSQLDQARRRLRQLERQLREIEISDKTTYPRGQLLLDEARQHGLISERIVAIDYETLISVLGRAVRDFQVRDNLGMIDGEDLLAELRAERQRLRSEAEKVTAEIRATRTFTSDTTSYEREAKEQRARLSAVGLFKSHEHDPNDCPLCNSPLTNPPPPVSEINRSLRDLSQQLEAVEAENPRLLTRLAALNKEEARLQELLRENQASISARTRENEVIRAQQESFIMQARTAGKITQYLDTISAAEGESSLKQAVESLRIRVANLERELDPDAIKELLNTFQNIIGRYMTEYSEALELEHQGSQLRLDLKNLTVIADTLDGPVPLSRMGSGENWVGYHILAHLALHKWFRQKGRPVPGFIVFDQPSQAHYPPEQDAEGSLDGLSDEDQSAVQRLFKLIADAAKEMTPNLQIIVLDHADLKHEWFSDAVIERWRRGTKLIPESWLS